MLLWFLLLGAFFGELFQRRFGFLARNDAVFVQVEPLEQAVVGEFIRRQFAIFILIGIGEQVVDINAAGRLILHFRLRRAEGAEEAVHLIRRQFAVVICVEQIKQREYLGELVA